MTATYLPNKLELGLVWLEFGDLESFTQFTKGLGRAAAVIGLLL
jgi:hypothetical protein